MTYEDIVLYHKGDDSLTKYVKAVGTYNPPSGRPIPLWAAEDIVEKCEQGHLLHCLGAECKTCGFLQRIGRFDGVPQEN
jgi:hypothetical protein